VKGVSPGARRLLRLVDVSDVITGLDPAPPFLPDSAQAPTIGEANDDVLPACSPLKSLSNCPGPLNTPLHSVNQLSGLVSLGQRSGPQSPGLNPAGRPCAQAPSRALVEQALFEPSKPKAAANRGPLNPEAYLKVENRHVKAEAWAYKEVVKVKTCLPLRVGPLVPGTSVKAYNLAETQQGR